jgi:hypothetical protein
MLTPVEKTAKTDRQTDPNAPAKEPRKRRKSAVYDGEGHEVLITMMCLKCRSMKPLAMFGLRKMADGAIRNQPWCRTCRSGAGTKKKNEVVEHEHAEAPATVQASTEVSGEHEAPATIETPAVQRDAAPAAPVPDAV